MKKSTKMILFGFAAIGLLVVWLGVTFWRYAFASDAVNVIAMEASDLYAQTPTVTKDRIEDLINGLHNTSVIDQLVIDSGGRTVDPWGTPFRVVNSTSGSTSITTVTSAGFDGWFDTWDDIQRVKSAPIEYP